ncbi:GNAT family N-acetyltransferase [Frigidibacter sp. ROC022]|uniref:GNAT family N-acetyltransferase n=1 Tax=Frigidibacter sp. ROC022 TaxID=2971796 RepID=UPI00215A59AF|nr:GNAT family N-acetyltransferase [Frigidibacter sp. ROC022]MCR8723617.1 GNAT family N-acetyltransferase [Frigidibacter sp. ROC022]
MTIPVIETERLRLRGFRPGDFAGFAAMWADPQVVRFIGGKPRTEDESWTALLRYAGYWPLFGHGFWAMTPRDEPDHWLGCIGFMRARRGFADLDGRPECGWVLARSAQGRGLAYEAAAAVHRWYDGQGFGPSFVMIETGHGASVRVAERCGYRLLREDIYDRAAMHILQRPAPWRADASALSV